MEAQSFKMLTWRVYIPVVADLHHFDKKQDPDPHQREKKKKSRIRNCIKVIRGIRIRIRFIVFWICNIVCNIVPSGFISYPSFIAFYFKK